MDEDWEFEETLRRLAGPVDRRGVWADIEARAGVAPWGLGQPADEGTEPRRARTHARWLTPRVAVFASVAVVLAAAVALGGVMAVRNLTRPDFVLVINDETIVDAGSTGAAVAGGTSSGQWERLSLTADGGNVTCLVIDPNDSSVLYAATDDGLFKSQDAAGSWRQLTSMEYRVFRLAIDPASSSTIYVLTENPGLASALFPARFSRSDDGGSTWVDLPAASPRFGVWSPIVLIDPASSPSTVYTYDVDWNMWRSTDRGETWTQLSPEEADSVQQLDLKLQRDGFEGTITDTDTGSVFNEVAGPIDPSDPSIQYAGTPEGVYKSTDGGQTWKKASAGLTSAAVWRLVTDPSSASILYAATSAGIFKTTDGGATWDMILGGQGSLALAPSSPSTLYAWTSAGLFRSDDGGTEWAELAGTGLAPQPEGWGPMFGGLVLVATKDSETVFAVSGAEYRQVFRSKDGGETWSQILGSGGSVVVPDSENPSTLYAVTLSGDMTVDGHLAQQISKSTDLGSTWTVVSPTDWGGDIATIAVDPHAPSNVYVARLLDTGSYCLWRSLDGGVTWENVGLEGVGEYLERFRFDPLSSDTLYVLTSQAAESDSEQGLYLSEDAGDTWASIGGEVADAGIVDIVVDSASGGALYAVTESGLFKWVPETK